MKKQNQKQQQSLKGWKDIPIGGLILEPGNAANYKTGGWRTNMPVHDPKICINCMFCWVYCPDSSIIIKDGKVVGIDYDHCKGCGICSAECPVKPVKAITMKKEK
ncbi:MAG: ferredoxin [Candidatus Omnitrophica bacterium CG12_big_fil_rev_8_21_14_0_65_43_15]|uniref:Ferredoxin n=1 Tax=Candidatus Taenaricola geysiri TaxID=1974752 RepID=A0A2J0LNG5_9BACT|nr:MAG: ferredoxin [Candidatus Omnitrophica bacterium CG1_02_43_210]PIR65746.1 MAG: ferredoxin [Candidatus Omnitrophica bacterium CG10_big_fil_rev_8_21_14_0_10_43_8]PIV12406.1 MAG: ferredoxin [Candidatus Omnitrophica bacterium CG03_land_8_20_14_0_80_43_22]PIW66276.1 MAG: ferredoxin [Candidatus Omnitrophica bacterium CG12_big_fil_rev_8_21_14_0_65_43_15]PIY84163.1 MAG: ferredoxin [Candidatus Omnitrophica bacterium CG_4_10_14_0_8_um_filter_43_18]PJC46263.1 MAG: ferredoxin [Candidatus Omnitrophica